MVSSSSELLVLHGLRVLGGPSVGDVARVYELDPAMVTEHLLDAEAYGWARRHDWYGTTSWSLTDRHTALDQVLGGEYAWLDAPDRPSCHLVWISMHEDLLATLGIERGTDDL